MEAQQTWKSMFNEFTIPIVKHDAGTWKVVRDGQILDGTE